MEKSLERCTSQVIDPDNHGGNGIIISLECSRSSGDTSCYSYVLGLKSIEKCNPIQTGPLVTLNFGKEGLSPLYQSRSHHQLKCLLRVKEMGSGRTK